MYHKLYLVGHGALSLKMEHRFFGCAPLAHTLKLPGKPLGTHVKTSTQVPDCPLKTLVATKE